MKRLTDTMIAVAKIGELATATLDTREIMKQVVAITAGIMKVDVCSIYLLDPVDGSLILAATRGLRDDAVGMVRINPGEGITGRAAKQGRMVAVPDVTRDPRNKYIPLIGEDAFRSLLSMPLKFHDELIGVINVQTRQPRIFQKHERRLLKSIAHQVSGSIRNARLFESVLSAKKELEHTHERLVESEKMAALGRLSATLSHELRNPIAGLKGASQLLQRKIPENDDRRVYVNLILEEVERLGRIVDDLLNFAKPGTMRQNILDANQVIQDVILLHSEDFNQRGITIRKRLSILPPIRADKDKFIQVIVNIIQNARDAMPEGGELLISSGVIKNEPEEGDFVTLQFKDTGRGIPDEIHNHIFEPFFTTKPSGVGLGLAICKTIVEEHGGAISLNSHGEKGSSGTVVTIRLPLMTGS
jgi:two-component system, NtrC family, sensor histidine kinase HydH